MTRYDLVADAVQFNDTDERDASHTSDPRVRSGDDSMIALLRIKCSPGIKRLSIQCKY